MQASGEGCHPTSPVGSGADYLYILQEGRLAFKDNGWWSALHISEASQTDEMKC